MKTLTRMLAAMAWMVGSLTAWAQVAPVCDSPQPLDRYQLLRRLSLDLRGHPPTIAEYNALDSLSDVPDSVVQQYLQSDDFRVAMRHMHELLFWPNVTNVQINNINSQLGTSSGFIRGNVVITHLESQGRGAQARKIAGYSCGDDVQPDGGQSFLQTHFLMLPDGGTNYEPDPNYVVTVVLADGGQAYDEGYRMVTPYWAPLLADGGVNRIPVCAYDAQETPFSATVKNPQGQPLPCNDYRTNGDKTCGCGPNLTFCYGGNAQQVILTALREQINLSVDDVTVGGHPYTDLVTSSKAHQNGVISFWKQNLAPNLSFANIVATPDPGEQLVPPVWDAAQPAWQVVDRVDPRHGGVTTLPAYFLRFQTDRSRANHFRLNFMCESFVPQAVLQAQPGCDPAAPDLTHRCYCQYCHAQLEPLAAYFGMFSEAGTTLMANNPMFPTQDMACTTPQQANNSFCQRYYVQSTQATLNPGSLLVLQWLPAHPDYQAHLSGGPAAWGQSIIADHTFEQCAAQRVFAYFVKRPMALGTGDASDETALLTSLSTGFANNQFSFPWLVDQVVSLPQYRRAH